MIWPASDAEIQKMIRMPAIVKNVVNVCLNNLDLYLPT